MTALQVPIQVGDFGARRSVSAGTLASMSEVRRPRGVEGRLGTLLGAIVFVVLLAVGRYMTDGYTLVSGLGFGVVMLGVVLALQHHHRTAHHPKD
jgi:hypothetical protein